MKKKLAIIAGATVLVLLAFPPAAGAITGSDALAGLVEVLGAILDAYAAYLGAL